VLSIITSLALWHMSNILRTVTDGNGGAVHR
jgi:hypothetical protein